MRTDLDTMARSAAEAVRQATSTVEPRALDETSTASSPRLRTMVILGVAAVLAVGALSLSSMRPRADSRTELADAPPTANDVRLLPASAAVPAGLERASVTDDMFRDVRLIEGAIVRIYSVSVEAPEQEPAIEVWSAPGPAISFDRPPDAEAVTVGDVPAAVFPNLHDGWTVVAGPYDGIELRLVGHHLTRDEVIAAAQTAQPLSGRIGAAIDVTSLASGLVERSVGTLYEVMYFSEQTLTAPSSVTGVNYQGAGDRSIWWFVARQPASELAYGRLFYDSIVGTAVNGNVGYFGTIADDSAFLGLSWADGDRSIVMGARNVSADEMLAVAESLRPATDDEWTTAGLTSVDVEADVVDTTTVVTSTTVAQIVPSSTNSAGFSDPITPARVLVANAAGLAGLAGDLTERLPDGYSTQDATNAVDAQGESLILERTQVLYAPGFEAHAAQLATELGATSAAMPDTPPVAPPDLGLPDLIVLVGRDHRTGWPAG